MKYLIPLAFLAMAACSSYESPPTLGNAISPSDPTAKQDWDSMHGPK